MPAEEISPELQPKPLCLRAGKGEECRIQPVELLPVGGAKLERDVHLRRDDVERTRLELHRSHVDDTAREIPHYPLTRGKGKRTCPQCGIQAVVHGRRAGMVGAAEKRQPVGRDAHNGRHHANIDPCPFQPLALLDVQFEIAGQRTRWASRAQETGFR